MIRSRNLRLLSVNKFTLGPLNRSHSLKFYSQQPTQQPTQQTAQQPIQQTSQFQQPQNLEDIGKEVSHSYTVQNRGPSTISQAEITILWPTRDLRGNFLLYLVDQVLIRGRSNKGFCRTITRDDLNPLGLKVSCLFSCPLQ